MILCLYCITYITIIWMSILLICPKLFNIFDCSVGYATEMLHWTYMEYEFYSNCLM
jgi:hypothetical protein